MFEALRGVDHNKNYHVVVNFRMQPCIKLFLGRTGEVSTFRTYTLHVFRRNRSFLISFCFVIDIYVHVFRKQNAKGCVFSTICTPTLSLY